MKTNKQITVGFLLLMVSFTKAQNTFPTSGNVGIGTTNPWATLQVNNPDLTKISFMSITGTSPGIMFSSTSSQNHYVPSIGLSTNNNHYLNNAIPGQFNIRGGVGGDIVFGNLLDTQSNGQELMRIKSNGNLGIGLANPSERLEVNGNIKFGNTLSTSGRMHLMGGEKLFLLNLEGVNISKAWGGNGNLEVEGNISLANQSTIQGAGRLHITGGELLYVLNKDGMVIGKEWGGNGNLQVQGNTVLSGQLNVGGNVYGSDLISGGQNSWIMHTPDDGRTNLYFAAKTNGTWDWSKYIYFRNDGTGIFKNIGIGTDFPDEKLTVKGKIHAEELIVDLQVPADYVFQKYYTGTSSLKSDYKMLTLAEVEQFTRENNHLPNVPSAKEIQEKGLYVGEMSNILLQKIEELTLYTIEQQKRIEILEAKLAEKK